MLIALTIPRYGSQGLPVVKLPWRVDSHPEKIGVKSGLPFSQDGKQMHFRLDLTSGVDSYQTTYKARFGEPQPLYAQSTHIRFGGASAPRDSLPKVTLHASTLHDDIAQGAQILQDTLDWLAYCTVPWRGLGSAPLLMVSVGQTFFYGYLESFDPNVTEWLPDGVGKDSVGLPTEASFTLSFIREVQGLNALDSMPKGALPTTVYIGNGTGGVNTGRGPELGQAGTTMNPQLGAKQAAAAPPVKPGAAAPATSPFKSGAPAAATVKLVNPVKPPVITFDKKTGKWVDEKGNPVTIRK
ncbi:hypothetical protein [Deinococcus kurensis]|uniref:hypothetical protein n=1 Tax=Deinococcus kurensis TaxID=2662757 RepID=UPI0012D31088|nr:hypothetical protein [Deinococcus kurensis]